MNETRDLVVARALSRLPIPDHEPGFWGRLEASLSAEPDVDLPPAHEAASPAPPAIAGWQPEPEPAMPEPARVPEPRPQLQPQPQPEVVSVTELRPVDGRRERRQRRSRILAVAAVSVAVIAGASWAISATDETGDGAAPAAAPTGSGFGTATTAPPAPASAGPDTTATAPTTAVPSTAAPTIAPLSADAQAAVDLVEQFLVDLGPGEVADAAARLGPRSEAYLQSLEPDNPNAVEEFLRQTAEGYGAWPSSPDATYTPIEIGIGEYVVVVHGTVSQEGTTAVRSIAVPVVSSASIPGERFVDLWAFSPEFGGQPEYEGIGEADGTIEGSTVSPGATVTAHVPVAGTVSFGVVGAGDLLAVPTSASAPGFEASWTFPTGVTGPQTFLTVYEADGILVANAYWLTVA